MRTPRPWLWAIDEVARADSDVLIFLSGRLSRVVGAEVRIAWGLLAACWKFASQLQLPFFDVSQFAEMFHDRKDVGMGYGAPSPAEPTLSGSLDAATPAYDAVVQALKADDTIPDEELP